MPRNQPSEHQGRHRGLPVLPVVDAPRLDRLHPGAERVLAFIVLGTVWLFGVGVMAVVDTAASPSRRTLGAAAVFAGVLTVISFWLYLRPCFLTNEAWRRSRRRHLVGVALRHAWICTVPAALTVWYLTGHRF